MAKLVSQTYGEALFELAMEQDKIDVFTEEIDVISEVLAKNPDFSKLMNHPKIDKENKLEIVDNVFLGRIDKELVGFLRLLITKGRYADLDSILQYFRNAVKEEKGIGVPTGRKNRSKKSFLKRQNTPLWRCTTAQMQLSSAVL